MRIQVISRAGLGAALIGISTFSTVPALGADWKAEHDAGWKAFKEGRLEEAELHLKLAEKEAKALGENDPALATTSDHLAWVLISEGKYSEAESLAKAALAIVEKGKDQGALAGSLSTLASVYDISGDAAKARPLYAHALVAEEKASGPDDVKVAAILDNLATVDHLLGKSKDAEASYKRALAIREKSAGAESADLAPTLHNLGTLYTDLGKYDEALPILKRSLAIREKALGAEHPDVAESLEELGWVYAKQSKPAVALPLLEKALALYEIDLGNDHPHYATAASKLGLVHLALHHPAEARAFSEKAVAILDKPGTDPTEKAEALEDHANILKKTGKTAEAKKVEERAKTIRVEPSKP